MEVTHTKTNVIQYNEYYAFGLQTIASWTRVDEQPNQYLYNSGSELNATTGWYETMFRDYDPAIGRFMQVDAMAEAYAQWSPYAYAMNNPVLMNDPTGLYPAWYPEGYGEGGDLEHRLFRDYSEGWSRRGENGSRYGGGSWGGSGGGGGYSPSARQIGNFIGQLVTSAHGGTWSEPWGLHVFGSEQEAAAWAARTLNSTDGWIFGSTEPDAYAGLMSIADGGRDYKHEYRWTKRKGSNVKFKYLGLAKGAAQQGGADPDLSSDARSWQYVPVGPDGHYQATGYYDYITTYKDAQGKIRIEYVRYKFNTLYFEFPRVRADGSVISAMDAARLSAAAKDMAEEQVEMLLGGQPRPATSTLENTFLTELRTMLAPFGARVSLTPNYGPVPVTPYSKTLWGNGR